MDALVDAVLAEVTCRWSAAGNEKPEQLTALVTHHGRGILILEASAKETLPAVGTPMLIISEDEVLDGRLAEHGRGGRFLVSLGERTVRRTPRLRVSLPGTLRASTLAHPVAVELADLTSGGARVRGVELPVGSPLTLHFTPPTRKEPVSVRAMVAHGTQGAKQPWIGVVFRLVAMRGGRQPAFDQ